MAGGKGDETFSQPLRNGLSGDASMAFQLQSKIPVSHALLSKLGDAIKSVGVLRVRRLTRIVLQMQRQGFNRRISPNPKRCLDDALRTGLEMYPA